MSQQSKGALCWKKLKYNCQGTIGEKRSKEGSGLGKAGGKAVFKTLGGSVVDIYRGCAHLEIVGFSKTAFLNLGNSGS